MRRSGNASALLVREAIREGGSPEIRLVLHLARVAPSDVARERLGQLLRAPLDWEAVVSFAGRHDILPLVTRHLAKQEGGVQPDALAILQREARAIALPSLRQALELADVVSFLEGAGVPVIPLKGPVLAEMAYGDLAYRRFVDLDLLVRQEHLDRAIGLLEGQGYEALRRDASAEERRARIESQIGYDLVHPRKGLAVELHWSFFSVAHGYRFDLGAIWGRHRWVPFAGAEVRALAPEDMLLYLCIHGMKHRWAKLKWVCDVSEYLRAHPEIDWEEVRRAARDLGVERIVRVGLVLARDLVETQLPQRVEVWVESDQTAQRLARQVVRTWLLPPPDAREVSPGRLYWFHFRERERWRDRVPYTLHNLRLALMPSEKDRAFLRLPKALGFLYLGIRPLRVALEWGRENVPPPRT